jgi:hypothetical protein
LTRAASASPFCAEAQQALPATKIKALAAHAVY